MKDPGRPVRVCLNAMLLPPNLGGIGNYTYHLARCLAAAGTGWEFHLLVNSQAAPAFRDIPGLRIIESSAAGRPARLAHLHLRFPFQAGRFDLVHSVGNMGLILCPAPQVITIHDAYECVSPERFSPRKRLMMRALIAASGLAARRIMTDSANSGRDIARFYPHLARKTSVVYLGNKFPVADQVDPDGRDGFLFVGTIEPGKNLPLVLEAFARFRGRPGARSGGRLRVAGAMGWRQSGLPALIDSLGLADAVEFLGYVPDAELPALYAGSLALIQASTYEGFGLPVIEAMASGCPVISARNSGLIEAGGDAALFFETGDRDGLVERMSALAGDRALRERCIRLGWEHARKFTWEKTAREALEVYRKALET